MSRLDTNLSYPVAAMAITIVIVWVLGMFKVEVPPEVGSAFTTLIGLLVGWAVPPKD